MIKTREIHICPKLTCQITNGNALLRVLVKPTFALRNELEIFWITNFKSTSSLANAVVADAKDSKSKKEKNKDKDKDKNKKDKPDQPQNVVHQLQISGLSSDVRNITEFTKKLSSSDYFKHPILSESNQQSFGYVFTINSEVTKGVQ